MFSFFKKIPSSIDTANLRREFDEQVTAVKQQPTTVRMAVGHAINMANSMFLQRYRRGENEFRSASQKEQHDYIGSMNKMIDGLTEKGMRLESIGWWLFKMWVGSLVIQDDAYRKHITNGLAELSSASPI